jgi:hypothetical protein
MERRPDRPGALLYPLGTRRARVSTMGKGEGAAVATGNRNRLAAGNNRWEALWRFLMRGRIPASLPGLFGRSTSWKHSAGMTGGAGGRRGINTPTTLCAPRPRVQNVVRMRSAAGGAIVAAAGMRHTTARMRIPQITCWKLRINSTQSTNKIHLPQLRPNYLR